MDSSGNLYGTMYEGGASGDGTIFELTGAATAAVRGIAASFVVGHHKLSGKPVSVHRELPRRKERGAAQ